MDLEEAVRLVELLQSGMLRCRTGIVEFPAERTGTVREIAARLGAEYADYIELLICDSPPNATILGIEPIREMDRLYRLAMQEGPQCVVVANFDFALSRLTPERISAIWQELYDRFPHRRRSLVFAMPQPARYCLPVGELAERWKREDRWASICDHQQN
ncbi:MAG: hypothetical protein GX446_00735 [Chthonomonadales bacterium]|nr:hypothetical protein [Chthonomonadales bacterium]